MPIQRPKFKPKSAWEILKVPEEHRSNDQEIKRIYRRLAKALHPDMTGSTEDSAFKLVDEAYKAIKDEEARKKYQSILTGARSATSAPKKSDPLLFKGTTADWPEQRKIDFIQFFSDDLGRTRLYSLVFTSDDLFKRNPDGTFVNFNDPNPENRRKFETLREAMEKLYSDPLLAGEKGRDQAWRKIAQTIVEEDYIPRIHFVLMPDDAIGNEYGSLKTIEHYPEFSIRKRTFDHYTLEDKDTFDTAMKEREGALKKLRPEISENHFIFLNMRSIEKDSERLGVDLLPSIVAHETAHMVDNDILRHWVSSNMAKKPVGRDALFKKYVQVVDGVPYLDSGFRKAIFELKAYAVAIEVYDALLPKEPAEEIKEKTLQLLKKELNDAQQWAHGSILERIKELNLGDWKSVKISMDQINKLLYDPRNGVLTTMLRTIGPRKGKCDSLLNLL